MISCNYCIATKVINYIHVLSNFHKSRQPPDVLREELWDRGVSSGNIGVSCDYCSGNMSVTFAVRYVSIFCSGNIGVGESCSGNMSVTFAVGIFVSVTLATLV